MSAEKHFILIQRLKTLSRVSIKSFLYENELDLPLSILGWLFEKSIDLVDGITQLHKSNLDECSQALIRVLFETYLKYRHYIAQTKATSHEDAAMAMVESIVLMKERDTLAQDRTILDSQFTAVLGNLDELKEKYTDDEFQSIKKYGFLRDSLEGISKKYSMTVEYNMMYRSFSRNVHANDFSEYFRKQGNLSENDYVESRNIAAFDFVLRIFIEMIADMNKLFELNMEDELQKITKEYSQLN